jgi:hypothetical protein
MMSVHNYTSNISFGSISNKQLIKNIYTNVRPKVEFFALNNSKTSKNVTLLQ